MKRVISFLLVLTMLCGFGPAFAQEEAPAEQPAEEMQSTESAEQPAAEEAPTEASPAEDSPAAEAAPQIDSSAEEISQPDPAAAEETASAEMGEETEVTAEEAEAPGADGDFFSNYTSISLGKTLSGTFPDNNSYTYYKFTLSSSGRVTLKLTATSKSYYYTYCHIYIYSPDGSQVWSDYTSYSGGICGETTFTADLVKGTYYLAIVQGNGGEYTLATSFASAGETITDTASNNTLADADRITLGETYKGQLAANDSTDLYKFVCSTSGRVTLKMTSNFYNIRVNVYSSDGTKLWTAEPSCVNDTASYTIDLVKGTYYLGIGDTSADTGNYTLITSFASAGESFTETGTDNTRDKANSITLGKTYKGQLALNGDSADYYTFTCSSAGTITLKLTAAIHTVKFYVYNASGSTVQNSSADWDSLTGQSVTTYTISVEPGVYYIGILQDSGYKYTYTGNYTLETASGSSTSGVSSISANQKYTATIRTAGGKAYCEFTPTFSRTYVIYSTGTEDVMVTLYDKSGKVLASDDNSGGSKQFKLSYDMTAGVTYRFAIYYNSSSATGKIPFTLARTYTVSYDANNGSGAPASQAKIYGQALTLSTTTPTRSGYTFLGWSESSTDTSAQYAAGGSYSENAATTLYAVWKKNTAAAIKAGQSYSGTITEGGNKLVYTFTPTASRTYVIYSTGSADTRVILYDASGKVLASDDDSGDNLNFQLSYAMTAGVTYRYAVYFNSSSATGKISFTLGRIYSVKYDANNGSGAPSAQTKIFGKTLKLSNTQPTRSGYTFLGWSESSTDTSAQYAAGGSYSENAATTLYAVWKKNTSSGPAITQGGSYTANITTGGGQAYYTFTPSISGTYVIYSSGNSNTVVVLYDANGKRLASDDNSGNNNNFQLYYTLNAGVTYRYAVYYYGSSATGTIPFTLERRDEVSYAGTGWIQVQGDTVKWYYFQSGVMLKSQWLQYGSDWYYFGKNGVMYAAKWCGNCYLQADGVMATGWCSIGGSWYYFNGSGYKQTGWLWYGNHWYYLGTDGAMYASRWNGSYYMTSDGTMATGWCWISGHWYYFGTDGVVYKSQWLYYASNWYYLKSNGQMAASETVSGYRFNAAGIWVE